MATVKESALREARRIYKAINDNFEAVFAKCKTDQQRRQLKECYSAAQTARLKLIEKSLSENNAFVKGIIKDLKATNTRAVQALKDLKDIEAVLKLVTEAVRLSLAIQTFGEPATEAEA